MSAKVKIHHIESTVLEVSGRITLGEGGVTIRDAIQETLNTAPKKLTLNVGINYMDSSGSGELTAAYTPAKNKGCELKLLHLSRRIDDLMQITNCPTFFDIYSDERQVRSFVQELMANSLNLGPQT